MSAQAALLKRVAGLGSVCALGVSTTGCEIVELPVEPPPRKIHDLLIRCELPPLSRTRASPLALHGAIILPGSTTSFLVNQRISSPMVKMGLMAALRCADLMSTRSHAHGANSHVEHLASGSRPNQPE